jgi:hypothetical protein
MRSPSGGRHTLVDRDAGAVARAFAREGRRCSSGSGGLLQRPLTVEEVANVAAFMATDR